MSAESVKGGANIMRAEGAEGGADIMRAEGVKGDADIMRAESVEGDSNIARGFSAEEVGGRIARAQEWMAEEENGRDSFNNGGGGSLLQQLSHAVLAKPVASVVFDFAGEGRAGRGGSGDWRCANARGGGCAGHSLVAFAASG